MQIHQVNLVTYKQQQTKKNTQPKQNINNTLNQNQSFKGVKLDGFCLGLANLIENGGLAVSFTLQDMLGTNLPRPFMGLMRNSKENNGEKNIKFALKELTREMLTGPSMFLIPMGMLAAGKPVLGKTMNVPMKQIKALGDIHAANPLNEAGNVLTKQDFYKNAFVEMIKNAKSETVASNSTIEAAEEFAEKLHSSISQNHKQSLKSKINNMKSAVQNMFKKVKDKPEKTDFIKDLSTEFTNIVKEHATDAVHTDFTKAKLSQTTTVPFREAVESMVAYADDVIPKVQGQDVSKISEMINKITNKKVITRLGTNIAMYAAVMGFLQIIPHLYNKAEGKGNAGLKGLMKEETLNDKSLDQISNTKTEKQGKANPSFGSSAQVVNKLTGSNAIGKIAQAIEFEGPNVSFPLLLGIMGFGILLPRTVQAKDKYDREEILRRDLVTCAVMCFAEKELCKGFSKLNEIKSGLVLASRDKGFQQQSLAKKFFDYLRPIKGVKVLSTDQIVSKYSQIDKYKDGIKGFCEFIDGQGGNLGKVFSVDEKAKNIVQGLLQNEGKNIATADNATIKETIAKAINSDEVKNLTDLFKNENNAWVKKAKTLNARFTALSVLILVPAFLGFLLPFINERATKKRIKEENKSSELNNTQISVNDYFNNLQKSNNIFSDMEL